MSERRLFFPSFCSNVHKTISNIGVPPGTPLWETCVLGATPRDNHPSGNQLDGRQKFFYHLESFLDLIPMDV